MGKEGNLTNSAVSYSLYFLSIKDSIYFLYETAFERSHI